MKRSVTSVLLIFFCFFISYSQPAQNFNKTKEKSKKPLKEKLFFDAYLKNLQTFNLTTDSVLNVFTYGIPDDNIINNNLFHNRLNFEFIANKNFSAGLELRNQLYIGEFLKLNPDFAEGLKQDDGFFDLKYNLFENNYSVLNTQIDRAWVAYQKDKWEFKIGRQRINWAINLIWNPNDIFNAYNFLDFDYEERPGTDAIKINYYPNSKQNISLVYRPSSLNRTDSLKIDNSRIGAKYAFNIKNYDVQIIGAYNQDEIVIGGGFAGNIKNGSLKAELSYFIPDNQFDLENDLNFSVGYDNIIGDGIFYQIAYLYNQFGIEDNDILLFTSNVTFAGNNNTLSAKDIFPFKNSFFIGGNYSINPRINSNFAVIMSPQPFSFILTPSFSYSIAQNWDFDFFLQSFFLNTNTDILNPEAQDQVIHLFSSGNLRFRWSF